MPTELANKNLFEIMASRFPCRNGGNNKIPHIAHGGDARLIVCAYKELGTPNADDEIILIVCTSRASERRTPTETEIKSHARPNALQLRARSDAAHVAGRNGQFAASLSSPLAPHPGMGPCVLAQIK